MEKIKQQFEKFYEKQMKEVEKIKNENNLKFYVSGKTVMLPACAGQCGIVP